jgi:hypothetical protein
MLHVQVFGAGRNNRNTAPEFWIDGRRPGRCEGAAEKAVPFPSGCTSILLHWQINRGIVMNTAVARRLALGDRVVWIGKDDYQPSGPGTITRITAHQVEVLWEDETARRYRRTQLHNLRHSKLICELHGEWVH